MKRRIPLRRAVGPQQRTGSVLPRHLTLELLEDRTLPSAVVSLQAPARSAEPAIAVAVRTNVAQVRSFAIDVDLNHDGMFRGAGELGYVRGDWSQATTAQLHGLIAGTYQLRARVVRSGGRQFVSAVQTMQVEPPPAYTLPVNFEPNVGQADSSVLFLGRAQDQKVYITETDTVLVSNAGAVQRFRLVGADPQATVAAQDLLPGVSNYFTGNDSSKWLSDVANYGEVLRGGVYPGIDLLYHSSQNRLEYDFHVAPGADPSLITLEFPDAAGLLIAADGSLLIHQADGGEDLRKSAPVMYQEVNGKTIAVKGDWLLKGPNQAGYTIAAYDRQHTLVIDPILFSSFLGGAGSDTMAAAATDSAGNFYVGGTTNSTDFPVAGAYQGTLQGSQDMFITKINQAGTAIVYSTYLGGSSNDGPNASGMGIAVDSLGQVAVTSDTSSGNYPTLNPHQATFAGFSDVVVTKLNAAGNALIFSTFMGCNVSDYAYAVAFDSSNNLFAVGQTDYRFGGGTAFPTTAGAFQTVGNGGRDAYIAKFDTAGTLIYSTLIAGNVWDAATGVAVTAAGNAVVVGVTQSTDFPATAGAYQMTKSGAQDLFVAEVNATGSALVYATHLGGTGNDGQVGARNAGIAVDAAGNPYIASFTVSTDFPTTAGAFQMANGGLQDGVVAKLNSTGTGLVYSTYLGGTGNEALQAITLDALGNAYVVGDTSSANVPRLNQVQNLVGPVNALMTELNPTGAGLVFSTPLGGGGDGGRGVGLDGSGNIWVACNGGGSFPQVNPLIVITGGNAAVAKIAPSIAGASFTQTGGSADATEGGATDTYTVVLTSPPSANVILTLTGGAQIIANPFIFTFMAAFWNIPQAIAVQAGDDFIVEGLHTGIVTTTASSADSIYNGIAIANVTVNITDNDFAGITITPSGGSTNVAEGGVVDSYTVILTSAPTANVLVTLVPDSQLTSVSTVLTFTPLTWNLPQPVVVVAVDDPVAEGLHNGVINHTSTSADPNYNGIALASLTAAITDNDTASVSVIPSGGSTIVAEGGASDTFTVVLTSQPTANVVITINPDTQLSVFMPVLTFTPANWNVAQNVTASAVNDVVVEGPHTGVVSFTATSTDPFYNSPGFGSLTVNITDNDTAGVTITETGFSTDVAEGGATDTYRVVLASQPTANVVVTPNPGLLLSVAPAVLTFTPAAWNVVQTVTVSAVDDLVYQGPHTGTIAHVAASTDAFYSGIAVASITANITDNDPQPDLLITEPVGGITALEGTSRSYTVALTTQPAADVVVNLGPDAQATLSQGSLTFTPADWNVPRNVVVTAVDDTLPEGNHAGIIVNTPSSADPIYNALPPRQVTAHVVDNDGTIIRGTPLADSIHLNFLATRLQVILNGKTSYLNLPLTQIVVMAGDANDYIQVTSPSVPVIAMGQNGADRVFVLGTTGLNTFQIDSSAVTVNNKSVSLWEAENLIVSGRTRNDMFIIQNTPAYTVELKGDQGNDTVFATNADNSWNVTGTNLGTLNGNIGINLIENWIGGTGDDAVVFVVGKGVTGLIDGGGGTNTLNYAAYATSVTVNLQAGTATGTKSIKNIGSVIGGLAKDKLVGPNQVNTWSIAGNNSGDVNGVLFAGLEILTGGTAADTFLIADGVGVAGQIDGGGGTDMLDFSTYSTAVKVDLQNKTATGTGGIVNLEQFLAGTSGNDTFAALNRTNLWTLTAPGTGNVNGLAFTDFANLIGGTGADTFSLLALGDWFGTLDAGTGRDALFAFAGGVNVWTNAGASGGTLNGHAFNSIEFRK